MKNNINHIASELMEHLPFTVFAVACGMGILGFLTFASNTLGKIDLPLASQELFHIFHPIHILFSAIATTAMFWRHEKLIIKALLIGIAGALIPCGLSDIFIPYAAGYLLGAKMQLHICLIEHPLIILPFLLLGVFIGFVVPSKTNISTVYSHSIHVLVSSIASLLYLTSFGLSNWVSAAGMVFVYMVIAVIVPCCSSDIVLPLMFIKGSGRSH